MKRLRILVAVPYYSPAIGGVESYSQAVVAEFKKQGHEVVVVTTKLAGVSIDSDQDDTIIRLNPWVKLSNTPLSPLWYFQIKKIIKKVQPHVIHVHSPVPFFADMTVLAAGKRIPILMTYHAGSMKKGDSLTDKVISLYENHFLPRIFRRVDKIGAVLPGFVTQRVKDVAKVEFTPPGIDTSIYKPGPHRSKRTTDVIFVGRIEKTSSWKGLDVLLQALALVKKERPDISVQIIGKGDAVDTYKELTKELSLDSNITFITNKRGEQMVKVYQSAKLIVLPSKTEAESFGMVLAEAMACGIAPIGSRVGGIPNVIQHEENGLLVPPGDAQALSSSILLLLHNSSYRQKLANSATLSINKKFTLKNMIKTNTALLNSIMMKQIVHISAYYPPHLGGMEAAISMLTNKLHDKAYRVGIVTSDVGVDKANLPVLPFPVTRLKASVVASTPIMPTLLWKLLRQSPRSIFHVHIAQAGIPEVAFLAAKLKRVPLVMHLHGDVEASSAAGFLLPLYKKAFLGFVLRRAQAVVVPTKNYKKTMTERYKLKNSVYVVPSGVDERFFAAEPVPNSRKKFLILFVGRLTVEKNVDLLIRAVKKVNYPTDFVIVGDGVLKPSLEKMAHENSTEDSTITLVGRKSPDELTRYYQEADILVLASNYESQSLVVLEAMATGTPVVVANVPAVNEVVGDGGMLIEKSASAFTQAIMHLIENPDERMAIAKKGQAKAHEFSWDILMHKFEGIYEDLEK